MTYIQSYIKTKMKPFVLEKNLSAVEVFNYELKPSQ